jgi:hypothetical protein
MWKVRRRARSAPTRRAYSPNEEASTFDGKAGIVLRVYRNDYTRSQLALRTYGGAESGRTFDLADFVVAFAQRTARDVEGIVRGNRRDTWAP